VDFCLSLTNSLPSFVGVEMICYPVAPASSLAIHHYSNEICQYIDSLTIGFLDPTMGNVTAQLAPATVENTRSAVAEPTYIVTAEKNIAEFIERSTRHSVADASCEWTRTGTADFNVILSVSLNVLAHDDDYTGRHHPGEHDVGTGSNDEYHATVDSAVDTERSRTETLFELGEQVAQAGYGKITEAFVFRHHPRRVFYSYKCDRCLGAGATRCSECDGRGKVQSTYTRTYTDQYGRTASRTEWEWINCKTCGGSGSVTCGKCSGHGCFTRVTTVNVMATPSYSASYAPTVPLFVRDALEQRAGLAMLLPEVADLHGEQIRQVEQEQKLAISYCMSCPWAEGTASAGTASAKVEVFGKNGSIHSVGGLLEKLVAGDAAILDESSSGPMFDRALAAARSGAVAKFMESEINQSIFELATQMVKAKTEAGGPKRISDQLNQAVSEEYVKRAIVAIEAIAGRTFMASSIVSIAAAAILSVPAFISAVLLFADTESALVVLGQRWLLAPGTNDLLPAALYTTPLTLFIYMALRFRCRQWAGRYGGKVLAMYLAERKRYPSYLTALALLIAAALPAVVLTAKLGVWLDADRTLYGSRLLVEQPKPAAPPTKKTRKSGVQ